MDQKLILMSQNEDIIFQGDNNNSKNSGSLKTHWAINIIVSSFIQDQNYIENHACQDQNYTVPLFYQDLKISKYCIKLLHYIQGVMNI